MPGRYDAQIDQQNDNDSHVLMLRLVGGGKRVLDVGCWNGDMGALLRERNVEVVGLEQDPEAAAAASKRLDQVVVGDVEALDLEAAFGSGRFDAIVLGDVLEHLVEPVQALRRLRPLLAPGGAVVASIPNVAHGSIRLHLLNGDFRYTDVGLLDRTHLRFFTRDSIEELFEDAGFVIVETRTTTVDPLAAPEAPIEPAAGDAQVVERVKSDPDAHVYQFVLRAVPDDGQHALRDLHRRQREAEAEVLALRRSSWGLRRARETGLLQVAVLGNDGDLPARWSLELLTGELERRLPEATPVLLEATDDDPSVLRWADAVLRIGRGGTPGRGAAADDVIGVDLTSATLVGIGAEDVDPGPALLGVALHAFRARKGDSGAGRGAMLRLLGLLPSSDSFVVVAVDTDRVGDPEGVVTAVRRHISDDRCVLVLPLQDGPSTPLPAGSSPVTELPSWLALDDVLTILDEAAAVITTHPTVAMLAYALTTPHALLAGDHASATLLATVGGGVATTASEIDAAVFRTEALSFESPKSAAVRARVDDVLDAVALDVGEATRHHEAPPPDPAYVSHLEDALVGLRRRIVVERARMAEVFSRIESHRLLDEAGATTREALEQQLAGHREAADSYRRAIVELQELLHAATRASVEPVAAPAPRWTPRRVAGGILRRAGLRRR